jgi:aldose sugar dehydrogenase
VAMKRLAFFITVAWLALHMVASAASADDPFRVVTIAKGLDHPWGMAFLPGGDILVTERPGRLRLIHNGALDPRAISGLPKIKAKGQGGLLDVALHPQYASNGWIYLSYSAAGKGGVGTEVIRAKLSKHHLTYLQKIFVLQPKSSSGHHFGSRLAFDSSNHLYITVGDRGERTRAQQRSDPAGSVIRLQDDGSILEKNPWAGSRKDAGAIFSYGHRNPQGLFFDSQTQTLWEHEHGPQGGDELNIIQSGKNYGWPIITYGAEYGFGSSIGEGTHKQGMEQPIYYWVPSIAPSGMTLYRGKKFPNWDGDILIGSLKFKLLVRLQMDGNKAVKEERFLKGKIGRIRDVRTGPKGYIYLLTDKKNGSLIRLEPKK